MCYQFLLEFLVCFFDEGSKALYTYISLMHERREHYSSSRAVYCHGWFFAARLRICWRRVFPVIFCVVDHVQLPSSDDKAAGFSL